MKSSSDFANPLDGNEWQERVRRWLRLRYPNDFQQVPAGHDGDRGIEGFSMDGNVYQCYAAREGFDVKGLYEHQRKKLTEDVGKFVSYREKLGKTLPPAFMVRRYCFVVPIHESAKLVEHANIKTIEIRNAGLPYIAPDFQIVIWDREDFAQERTIEERAVATRLQIELPEVSGDDLENWQSAHGSGVSNLERKIALFAGLKDEREIRSTRNQWITTYIRTANALERLRAKSPSIWEELNTLRIQHERRLGLRYGLHLGPAEAVQRAADDLAAAFHRRLPNLDQGDAGELSDGIVADWLQKCALNPQAPESYGKQA